MYTAAIDESSALWEKVCDRTQLAAARALHTPRQPRPRPALSATSSTLKQLEMSTAAAYTAAMTTNAAVDPRKLARSSDPSTSHDAAFQAVRFVRSHHERIAFEMQKAGVPLGAEQIAALCDLQPYEVRKRLPEMRVLGKVQPTDAVRETLNGRKERVWRLM
jgi:hypothetical protein